MRPRRNSIALHKKACLAITTSALLHAIGYAALVIWPLHSTISQVKFAGSKQTFQVNLSFSEPLWEIEEIEFDDLVDDRDLDTSVVIEPSKARIGKHSFVHSPTIEVSADDLLLDAATEPTPEQTQTQPREQTIDKVSDVVEKTVSHPPTNQQPLPHPQETSLASSTPPSKLGNSEEIPPDLSQNVPPVYPAHAVMNALEGTVLLRVWIDRTGQVTKVEVARSSGHRILDGAAAKVIRHWKALPASRAGKAVATVKLLPVRFKL